MAGGYPYMAENTCICTKHDDFQFVKSINQSDSSVHELSMFKSSSAIMKAHKNTKHPSALITAVGFKRRKKKIYASYVKENKVPSFVESRQVI